VLYAVVGAISCCAGFALRSCLLVLLSDGAKAVQLSFLLLIDHGVCTAVWKKLTCIHKHA
jgi:hypothetical protein